MPIQPVVLGTAGHIDHGKSTLVRALTGIDPDRLEEEQRRGMTIDLGFANLRLSDGRRLGVVDVPGHERFVRNMVAGATGIDLVLLVVAADDGVMPQTREHLAILELLGVRRGLVALSKIDLVAPELVELAEEEVRETLAGTALRDAPLVRVCAPSGEGLERLRAEIERLALAAEPRSDEGVFRMPVQRVFSAKGFGTVVTGIPLSGRACVGDALEVLPAGLRGRVRGIEAYHESAPVARAGHSSALNLADLARESVRRGDVLATPGFFRAATLLGARVRALAELARPLADRERVRLHVGTAEVLGELVLLEERTLAPGAEALAQLRLDEPVVCAPGDRFVLRRASPLATLGGGVVLELSRHRLKRGKAFVLEGLALSERGLDDPAERLAAGLERAAPGWLASDELGRLAQREREPTRAALESLARAGRARELAAERWIAPTALEAGVQRALSALARHLERNAHRELAELRELRPAVAAEPELADALLGEAARRGLLVLEPGGTVRPASAGAPADPALEERLERVHAALHAAAFQPPEPAELARAAGLSPAQTQAALARLLDRKRAVRIGAGIVLAAERVAEARAALEGCLAPDGELSIPALRDRLSTSRKFLIPLLEHFDAQGLTLRQGAKRVLRRR